MTRSWLLATALHIPPPVADEMSAVDLDDLLFVHTKVSQLIKERADG